ncbi:MAG: hypothetical protein RIE24_02610 [Silicimonas sp.]
MANAEPARDDQSGAVLIAVSMFDEGLVTFRDGRVTFHDYGRPVDLAEFDPACLDQTGPLLK